MTQPKTVKEILDKVCNTVRIFPEQDDDITIKKAHAEIKEAVRGCVNKLNYPCICDKDNLPMGITCMCGAEERQEFIKEVKFAIEKLFK